MNPLNQFKAIPPLLIALALLGFALLPKAQAVVPAPDGGYPGFNTAEGQKALFNLTTGTGNTAVGGFSLFSTAAGSFNTGVGAGTLLFNIGDPNAFEGIENTAVGTAALLFNTTGSFNNAVGVSALLNNDSGFYNNAHGGLALTSNVDGSGNNAFGDGALGNNVSGFSNTAIGDFALAYSTGSRNTALGALAGGSVTTGTDNIALGNGAGSNVTTANNVICIGTAGANVSNSCYIGQIYGTFNTAQSAVVYIDPDGRLGTGPSARRFKKDIADMGADSEVLLSMRPVTFHFKTQDTEKAGREISQFGLIAEEVAEVNPDLILRDKEGKIYSVRYDAVNAMLLNEFLKEHKRVEEQEATIAQVKSTDAMQEAIIMQLKSTDAKQEAIIVQQQKQIEALTEGLQKVSAQLEANKSAPQVVLNNQ
jgi:uncharacterized coiled-coil protein SlyX